MWFSSRSSYPSPGFRYSITGDVFNYPMISESWEDLPSSSSADRASPRASKATPALASSPAMDRSIYVNQRRHDRTTGFWMARKRSRTARTGARRSLKPICLPRKVAIAFCFYESMLFCSFEISTPARARRGAPKEPTDDRRVPVLLRLHRPAPRGGGSAIAACRRTRPIRQPPRPLLTRGKSLIHKGRTLDKA